MLSRWGRNYLFLWVAVFLSHFIFCLVISRSPGHPNYWGSNPLAQWKYDAIAWLNYPLVLEIDMFQSSKAMFATSAAIWATVLTLIVYAIRVASGRGGRIASG